MNYYSDLKFIMASHSLQANGTITRENCGYYCLQYNHEGSISIQLDDNAPIQIEGPSLLLTHPNMKFSFGTGNKNTWHHNYIAFTGNRVDAYVKSNFLPIEKPIITIHDGPGFLSTFTQLCNAFHKGSIGHNKAAHCFENLLIQIHEQSKYKVKETNLINEIHKLIEEIRNNPSIEWDFKLNAKKLHVSYGHFRRLFNELTNLAPQNFVIQARLSKASKLLLSNNIPIKEIAQRVGIPDIHYFTKLFKRTYHFPPARYRKELRT